MDFNRPTIRKEYVPKMGNRLAGGDTVRTPDRVPSGVEVSLEMALKALLARAEKENPHIARLSLRLLSKGGENIVLESSGAKHKGTVYKFNFLNSWPVLIASSMGQEAFDAAVSAMKEKQSTREADNKELRQYFGDTAVIPQRSFVWNVPVSFDLAKSLMPKQKLHAVGAAESIPVWVTMQRKMDLRSDDVLSVTGYYPEDQYNRPPGEKPTISDEAYDLAHEILIGHEPFGTMDHEKMDAIVAMYPDLGTLNMMCHESPAFRDRLADLTSRLISYAKETGKVLDLAGDNNLLLERKEKGWKTILLDVLPGIDIKFDDILPVLEKYKTADGPSRMRLGYALNVLNTVRFSNALAEISGVKERIAIDGLEQVPAAYWRENLPSLLQR